MRHPSKNLMQAELYPSCFQPPEQHIEWVAILLGDMYKNPHRAYRIMACLVNHCFTARTPYVMVSLRILQNATDNDPSFQPKVTLQTRDLGTLAILCSRSGLMHIEQRGVRGNPKVAGLNCLSDELIAMMHLTEEELLHVGEQLGKIKKSGNSK